MKQFSFIIILSAFIGCAQKGMKSTPIPEICNQAGFSQDVSDETFSTLSQKPLPQGHFIEISGFFRFNFEDVALYESSSSDSKNAIWLDLRFPKNVLEDRVNQFNGKLVKVIGRVDTTRKGHLRSYHFTLDSTFCLRVK